MTGGPAKFWAPPGAPNPPWLLCWGCEKSTNPCLGGMPTAEFVMELEEEEEALRSKLDIC